MRICVLIPSEEYVRQAGFRIRYQRIESELSRLGHSLRFRGISDAVDAPEEDDVFLLSKCYDARAFLAMHKLRSSGKLVGIDLFDDYFSQHGDSRFIRFRRWLRTSLENIDFVVCSTPALRTFIAQFARIPHYIMNDPVGNVDSETIAQALKQKPLESPLRVAWFGMGDNPNFPVGVEDFVACAGDLFRLHDRVPISVTIQTNPRALTAATMARLSRLPFPCVTEEWDEAAEKTLLSRSHVVFLPVNAQNFSVAKSLNRALSALSAGCQVLSTGYSLYEPLDDFLYRDPDSLSADYQAERLRMRAATVPSFVERLRQLADPALEADHLSTFLASLDTDAPKEDDQSIKPGAMVFGYENHPDMYNLVRSAGLLSVRSPFSNSRRKFDLQINWSKKVNGFEVYVEARVIDMLNPNRRNLFNDPVPMGEGNYARLVDLSGIPQTVKTSEYVAGMDDKIRVSASYPATMRSIAWISRYLFTLGSIFVSEEARLPLSFSTEAEHVQEAN